MILALALATFAFGAVVGGGIVRHYLTHLSQTARDDRRYRDAIALLRNLTDNPDALTLRPDAQKLVDDHEAATSTNRKDI